MFSEEKLELVFEWLKIHSEQNPFETICENSNVNSDFHQNHTDQFYNRYTFGPLTIQIEKYTYLDAELENYKHYCRGINSLFTSNVFF